MLRARTDGLAAVWASGFRARDGQRTSVLGAAPGASEQHAVWLATPEQVAVLDRCEGAATATGWPGWVPVSVHTDDGLRIEAPWCYLGLSAIRRPLLVGRAPVRCADLGQAAAFDLDGVPAPDDGLSAITVHGAPNPDEWPAALFVYGTLQPGQPAWPLARRTRHRTSATSHRGRARVRHRLRLPRPAPRRAQQLHPAGSSRCVDPRCCWRRLDRYEGAEYRRIRVAATTDERARHRLLDLRLDGRRRRDDSRDPGLAAYQHDRRVST